MKNRILQIRVSESELKALKALAAINCTTVTGLIVTKLLGITDYLPPVITAPLPEIRKIQSDASKLLETKPAEKKPFKSRLKGEWKP